MSYYHTYRPQQFSHLVGQESIAQILQEALRSQRLAHAYLFCGTRGTGKTTTARLLAKAINCGAIAGLKAPKVADIEPCNSCDLCQAITAGNCLDIIEIDAASNRGIDEIRQLQEQIRFRPQIAKKKIFIIDEVHMLTKEAFNALLKTLEEPPEYLLFILATTEPHKLPATIISRCQRFDFQTPNTEVIQRYLDRIAQAESLAVEAEATTQLAELANGSFRDSTTLLEQVAQLPQPIGLTQVRELLGLPEASLIDRFLQALATQAQEGVDEVLVADLQVYFQRGGNAVAFIDTAFRQLARNLLTRKDIGESTQVLQRLVQVKYQLKYSPVAELPILVAVTQASPLAVATPTPKTVAVAAEVKSEVSSPILDTVSELAVAKTTVATAPKSQPTPESTLADIKPIEPPVPSADTVTVSVADQVPPADPPSGDLAESWQRLMVQLIEQSQSSMVAILRTAKPLSFEPPVLKIGVQFAFHADQLSRQKNRGILEATLSQVMGVPVRIECDVQPVPDLVSAAEEIFS